ncbi:hypothetical protein [Ruania rhizosphaerae]|uniref:hypothetical protein n=1 Tax=Ruania rhizosphaerae TaxID=1840413 RepID=UPI001359804A|nr:hypothetical protein [Ruania rhizosphaerae]
MPANEPVQQGPYPTPPDPPDGPNQMSAIVTWAAGRLNMRFADVPALEAEIPSPVEGMEAFTGSGSSAVKWIYVNGDWVRAYEAGDSRLRRERLTGTDVIAVESGWSLVYASAVIDTDPEAGTSMVTMTWQQTGVAITSGAQNVALGSLAVGMPIPKEISFGSGSAGSNFSHVNVTTSGSVALRYQVDATSSGATSRWVAVWEA